MICANFKRQYWRCPKIFTVIMGLLMMTANNIDAQNYGLLKPQDPATLPKSLAPIPKAIKKGKVPPHTILSKIGADQCRIRNGWELIAAAKTDQSGQKYLQLVLIVPRGTMQRYLAQF
ncbi:MAG: Exo-beta-D-glucosaminidase [Mucilaginibacter sp.]|nr:Exo-beta-D-glucosaminidase [Mucilaginibacter sp.]